MRQTDVAKTKQCEVFAVQYSFYLDTLHWMLIVSISHIRLGLPTITAFLFLFVCLFWCHCTFPCTRQNEYKKDLEHSKGHSINFCDTPQFKNHAKVANFTSDVRTALHTADTHTAAQKLFPSFHRMLIVNLDGCFCGSQSGY